MVNNLRLFAKLCGQTRVWWLTALSDNTKSVVAKVSEAVCGVEMSAPRAGFPIDGKIKKETLSGVGKSVVHIRHELPIGVIEAERPLRIFVFVRKESQ